jgi:hypothetical protein
MEAQMDSVRLGLEDLEAPVQERLRSHPEVRAERKTMANAEFLVLAVEPQTGPCRSLRIGVSDLDGERVYFVRWSYYRAPSYSENRDGSLFGDLQFALRAIEHWIFDRMEWTAVPEFRLPDKTP